MPWKIAYYNESVEQEVRDLHQSLKAKYFSIADLMIEHGPNLGMPYTRAMGNGLFEIRAKGQSGIARAFFCTISKQTIIILHVFVKKTEKTPQKELEMAKKRMKEVKNYGI